MIDISDDVAAYLELAPELDERNYCLVVRTTTPFAEFARSVHAAMPGWNADIEARDGDDGLFELRGPISTPWGPSLMAAKYMAPIERSLLSVAELLNRAGIDGTIVPPPAHYPATWSDDPFPKEPRATLTARVELSGRALLSRYGRDPVPLAQSDMAGLPVWQMQPDDLRAACDRLVRWCLDGRDRSLVALGGEGMKYRLPSSVSVEDAARLMSETAIEVGSRTVGGWVDALAEDSATARVVRIHLSSSVVDASMVGRDADTAVLDSLAALSALLRDLAPFADYGHIRRELPQDSNWNSRGLPKEMRLITERGLIADPFGIQLLGPAIAPKIDSGSLSARWNVTDVRNERLLIESREQSAWFGDRQPHAAALAQARRDFSNLLARPEAT